MQKIFLLMSLLSLSFSVWAERPLDLNNNLSVTEYRFKASNLRQEALKSVAYAVVESVVHNQDPYPIIGNASKDFALSKDEFENIKLWAMDIYAALLKKAQEKGPIEGPTNDFNRLLLASSPNKINYCLASLEIPTSFLQRCADKSEEFISTREGALSVAVGVGASIARSCVKTAQAHREYNNLKSENEESKAKLMVCQSSITHTVAAARGAAVRGAAAGDVVAAVVAAADAAAAADDVAAGGAAAAKENVIKAGTKLECLQKQKEVDYGLGDALGDNVRNAVTNVAVAAAVTAATYAAIKGLEVAHQVAHRRYYNWLEQRRTQAEQEALENKMAQEQQKKSETAGA